VKELIPRNWQSSIERLRSNINSAFERCLSKFKRRDAGEEMTWSPTFLESIERGIDLDDTDDTLIARLALPGLNRGDFKVEVTEDRIVIRGGKKQSSSKKSRGYSHIEENQTAFAQAITLPCEIDREKVKARLKNGLLTVTMPKTESAKSRRIRIAVKT